MTSPGARMKVGVNYPWKNYGWDFGEDPVKDVVNDVDLADADDEGWDFVSEPVARPAPKPVNADDWNFGDVRDPVSVPAKTADEWSF